MKTVAVVALLFAFLAVSQVAAMFFLVQIDERVKTLDDYGLRYENAWLANYSMLTLVMFGLMLFDVAFVGYVLFSRFSRVGSEVREQRQQKFSKR